MPPVELTTLRLVIFMISITSCANLERGIAYSGNQSILESIGVDPLIIKLKLICKNLRSIEPSESLQPFAIFGARLIFAIRTKDSPFYTLFSPNSRNPYTTRLLLHTTRLSQFAQDPVWVKRKYCR